MSEWKNKTALITGASYGIGESFARRLAAEGANVIITARSRERLEALAAELRERHRVAVTVIEADLARPEAAVEIFRATEAAGLQVDLLVNNAGFGIVGDFATQPREKLTEMIQVNVTALVELAHLYLQPMLERRAGAIINLASTASFQAVPYFAVYAATKSFILIFSESLWAECSGSNVRVLALCPGPTATHFQSVAGTAKRRLPERMQTADEVVEIGLKALAQGRSHVVSGLNNKLMVEIERFVPRDVVTRLAAKLFRQFSSQSSS
ncbi:MAG TPA: SDR family oxidoreductase [Blastocatellia bacterium]|nr:SDR family oxidoreductase [Blastocatellia bacterium]